MFFCGLEEQRTWGPRPSFTRWQEETWPKSGWILFLEYLNSLAHRPVSLRCQTHASNLCPLTQISLALSSPSHQTPPTLLQLHGRLLCKSCSHWLVKFLILEGRNALRAQWKREWNFEFAQKIWCYVDAMNTWILCVLGWAPSLSCWVLLICFVLRFKSSHHLILYIVNLGCAPASLSLPSDSIVWPVWLFFRSTWTRVVLCLFLTSRMSARHCYTQSQCVFILDGDTLWYIAYLQRLWGSAEARSSTKACPQSRPMNIEMECFHYSASHFTKLEAAPMEQ